MAKKAAKVSKSTLTKTSVDNIPNAELDVLSCVWREAPVTAKRIREMMKKTRPMAHGSVVTLLTRLETKGLVSREKGAVGKAFVFKARAAAEPTHRKLTRDFLHRVFAGDISAMFTAMIDAETPTPEQLGQIQKQLQTIKPKARKKTRN